MTDIARTAADTGLPEVTSRDEIEPKNLLDLGDDFNRIVHLIRVISMLVEKPARSSGGLSPNDRALGELCWTIEERCEAFGAELDALARR